MLLQALIDETPFLLGTRQDILIADLLRFTHHAIRVGRLAEVDCAILSDCLEQM